MDMREPKVHSFIVKIWQEEDDDEAEKLYWRGHITHVPSGKRRHLKRLNDVSNFIEPYLANPDDESGRGLTLRSLIRRLSLNRTERFH